MSKKPYENAAAGDRVRVKDTDGFLARNGYAGELGTLMVQQEEKDDGTFEPGFYVYLDVKPSHPYHFDDGEIQRASEPYQAKPATTLSKGMKGRGNFLFPDLKSGLTAFDRVNKDKRRDMKREGVIEVLLAYESAPSAYVAARSHTSDPVPDEDVNNVYELSEPELDELTRNVVYRMSQEELTELVAYLADIDEEHFENDPEEYEELTGGDDFRLKLGLPSRSSSKGWD